MPEAPRPNQREESTHLQLLLGGLSLPASMEDQPDEKRATLPGAARSPVPAVEAARQGPQGKVGQPLELANLVWCVVVSLSQLSLN
jgi:hypothetical protein